jgi:hypothetical protein
MKDQQETMKSAAASIFATQAAFLDLQAGPSPLTPEEVRRLIERRPDRYSTLHAFAAPR